MHTPPSLGLGQTATLPCFAPELTAKLLGNRVAVSPIVTVEPRRRKFHKPITLTIPVPQAAGKGMINQYNGETPTLRLLCSITGKDLKWRKLRQIVFVVAAGAVLGIFCNKNNAKSYWQQ